MRIRSHSESHIVELDDGSRWQIFPGDALIAALPREVPCELRFCDLEASAVGDGVIAKDGRLAVPDGPGLGFEVDLGVVEKYRVR